MLGEVSGLKNTSSQEILEASTPRGPDSTPDFTPGRMGEIKDFWDKRSPGLPWDSLAYKEKLALRCGADDTYGWKEFSSFSLEVQEAARKRREQLCSVSHIFITWDKLSPYVKEELCRQERTRQRVLANEEKGGSK